MRPSTASAICAALVTSMRATPGGVASDVGPATTVTCAPASAAACAIANPILPELEFVMPRTGSIASNVGPAVSSTRLPASTFGWRDATSAAKRSSGSSIRPSPFSLHASSPVSGPRIATPSCASCAMLRWVALFAHICRFIAGATSSGHSRARHSVDRRSSARPCASLARKSAEAGATMIASAPRETAMWPIALAAPDSHRSVNTGRPESAWNVTAVTKCVAASVMTTSTTMPALTSRRVSSAALYAAMPPVTPSTTRASAGAEAAG